jgi:hypothetical protein
MTRATVKTISIRCIVTPPFLFLKRIGATGKPRFFYLAKLLTTNQDHPDLPAGHFFSPPVDKSWPCGQLPPAFNSGLPRPCANAGAAITASIAAMTMATVRTISMRCIVSPPSLFPKPGYSLKK